MYSFCTDIHFEIYNCKMTAIPIGEKVTPIPLGLHPTPPFNLSGCGANPEGLLINVIFF